MDISTPFKLRPYAYTWLKFVIIDGTVNCNTKFIVFLKSPFAKSDVEYLFVDVIFFQRAEEISRHIQ